MPLILRKCFRRGAGCRILIGVWIVAAVSCAKPDVHESVHWSYSGESGPDHWGELSQEFQTCEIGRNQSPIDVVNPVEAALAPIEIHYDGRTKEILNNGHTIQINVEPGSWLSADGARFDLAQFHFHSPSEHRVRGASFPFEVHFVHRNQAGELAVVGVVFREGAPDTQLASIWSALPAAESPATPVAVVVRELALMPDDLSYFQYNGSLTTPPCTEGVRWYVVQAVKSASPEQVAAFVKVVGTNARPPQPLNARHVLQ